MAHSNRKQGRPEGKGANQAGPADHPERRPGFDIETALKAAIHHHRAGRLRQAEALYRQILEVRRDHADALHLMGVLAHQIGEHNIAIDMITRAIASNAEAPLYHYHLGEAYRAAERFETAVQSYQRSLALDPNYAHTHYNLANALMGQGQAEKAAVSFRRALALKPDDPDTHNNLGDALMELGRPDEAVASFRRALDLKPDYPEVYLNLGNALKRQGRHEEAIQSYRKALELEPRLAEAHYNLGLAFGDLDKPEEAVSAYREALAIKPDYVEAQVNLGQTLKELGKLKEAVACYQRAIETRPDYAIAHNNLGTVLLERNRPVEAAKCFEEALGIDPEYVEALNNLALALMEQRKSPEALPHLQKALDLNPDFATTHMHMGIFLQQQGRFEEAIRYHERALALDPELTDAHYHLSFCRKSGETDNEMARIEELLQNESLPGRERIHLSFTLAKMCDDLGLFDKAFTHYRVANELAKEEKEFDADGHEDLVTRSIATFSSEFFEQKRSLGSDSELPVFVIGMLRSGTTLVEQIIASHGQAFGASELEHIPNMIRDLPKTLDTTTPYPECAGLIDREAARRLAEDHLESLRALSDGEDRVVDKMPSNYLRLGIIALLFPKASIIHCRRDPLDTCLSCYFQHFRRGIQQFSYDLGNLARVYRQYERLMDHWRRASPVPILEVAYEELVSNQEKVSRQIIEFCGLEWDDKCLAFYEHERTVRTASLWQVRQPIYASSVGRWRHYEKYLGPLKEALGMSAETPPS
ncbi:MAG: tetratricopeptide repeat protein [Proteobacteria bacterium]|nr:tetratricopeptide repeat protein [Pseudomonadota bacterium]